MEDVLLTGVLHHAVESDARSVDVELNGANSKVGQVKVAEHPVHWGGGGAECENEGESTTV